MTNMKKSTPHVFKKSICENLSKFERHAAKCQYINSLFVEQEIKPCEIYPLVIVTMLFLPLFL